VGTLLESELSDLENLAPTTEEQQLLARFMSTMGASADNSMLAHSLPGSRVHSARHPKKKPNRMPVNMWQV
jgi:hypothetical protein